MSNPLISVIVPVYKVEKYLANCIESVQRQSYFHWELILVDDGSPDRCPQICDEYASHDDRIRVVHKVNEGASKARNLGVSIAKGSYVLFIDADDYISNKLFERIRNYIGKYDVIHWSYQKVTDNTTSNVEIFKSERIYLNDDCNEFFSRLVGPFGKYLSRPEYIDSLNPIWLNLYSLDIIRKRHILFSDLQEIGSSEDLLFNIEYFKYVKSIACIPDCLYAYRRDNAQSFTSSGKDRLINQWNVLYSRINNIIKGDPFLEACLVNRKALGVIGILLNEYACHNTLKAKYHSYKNALQNPMFNGVYDKLEISRMPLYWRLFFYSVKYKNIVLVTFLIEAIQFLRKLK